jgi:hypothetical protein
VEKMIISCSLLNVDDKNDYYWGTWMCKCYMGVKGKGVTGVA